MTTIAILPVEGEDNQTTFSAVTTKQKATGRTAGEALDALTAQLTAKEAAATVIIQRFQPDQFFPAAQRDRLSALMARWRAARETGGALPPEEQAELERLVDEEAQGSTERATHILCDLQTTPLRRRDDKTQVKLRTRLAHQMYFAPRFFIRLAAIICDIGLLIAIWVLLRRGTFTDAVSLTLLSIIVIGRVFLIAIDLLFTSRHRDAAYKRADSFDRQAEASERRKAR
jgi:hypothetical protein